MSTKHVTQKGYEMFTMTVKRAAIAGAIVGLAGMPGYAQEGESIEIPAGNQSAQIEVQTIDNTIAQRDRGIVFTILSGDDYTVAEGENEHTYTINDNDMPQVGFIPGLPTSGSRTDGHEFRVSVTGATSADYPIAIEVSGEGTAQEGVHYERSPVDIPAGQDFEGEYEIARILPGALRGGEKTLALTVSGDALDFNIVNGNHAYTLLADDSPTVRLETYINGVLADGISSHGNEGDEHEIEFRMVLNYPWDEPITVGYQITGTAQEGLDYQTVDQKSVTFNPGETQKTIQYSGE